MCGIVGVVTKKPNGFSKDQQDLFANLLFVDMLRGDDSTGVFVVGNQGDVYVAKDEGNSIQFMHTKEYAECQRRAWNSGAAMIGHNRKATRGEVTDANAHPFNVSNNIILVHNGTMRGNHKKLADVEVDSHAIAHMIQEKASVQEALSSFDAAYALIWYDIAKGELNMIRNDERPLYWMETTDAWLWCSEPAMLDFAVTRVGFQNVVEKPCQLPKDVLQTFTLGNKGWAVDNQQVEIKKPVTSYPHHSTGGNDVSGGTFVDDIADWEHEGGPFRGWHGPGASGPADDWPDWRRERQAANRRREESYENRPDDGEHPRHNAFGNQRPQGIGNDSRHTVVQLQPRPQQQQPGLLAQSRAELKANQEPEPVRRALDKERAMAAKLNKRISNKHYRDVVLGQYPFGTTVHVTPFDYAYANGLDDSDGYYLYACPFDDDDVIIRHWFPKAAATEERMIQLAGCEYIFEFTLGVRSWQLLDTSEEAVRNVNDMTEGYVVIKSNAAKMISSPDQHTAKTH